MAKTSIKIKRRERRKTGLRKQLFGTSDCPRLSVFRSAKHIYAQIIDDAAGRTLCAASSHAKGQAALSGGNKQGATRVGALIAEAAKSAGIARVCFDRNGFKYHGRVKALADAAREAGLQF